MKRFAATVLTAWCLITGAAWAADPAKFEIHAVSFTPGENVREYPVTPGEGSSTDRLLLDKNVLLDGAMVKSAEFAPPDASGGISIQIRLTPEGKQRFAEITTKYLRQRIALVLDEKVIMAVNVASPIYGGTFQIVGDYTGAQLGKLLDRIRGCIPAAAP